MRFQRPPYPNRNFGPKRRDERPDRPDRPAFNEPPDVERDEDEGSTVKESEYLRGLTEQKTPISVHLRSGESFKGFIEYYDKRFIRLTRQGEPNLFIYKHDIKYMTED